MTTGSHENPVIDQVTFAGRDVLEVGCGRGSFTLEHLAEVRSYLGIDTNAEAIQELRAAWPQAARDRRIKLRVGDIREYPLPRSAFDVAVFSDSF